MTNCADCGVGSRGAVLVDVAGETLCTSCADGHCERCGTATEHTTRADGQGALDDFA